MQPKFVHSQYFCSCPILNIQLANYLVNEFNTFKISKILDFCELLILRYQFIGITLSKPHLVCTFYDKQINAKKYEWKFGSLQVLLVGDCARKLFSI